MVEVTSNVSRSSDEDHLLVLGVFLLSGLLSGLMFGWLVSRPELQAFFYFKSDKFLIPRYSYWFAFSLIQLLGLVAGFSVSCWRKWLDPICSRVRLVVAVLVIGLATPFLWFMTPLMNAVMGLRWDLLIAPIGFLVLISFAMCVLTGSMRLLPIATIWNAIFAAVGFVMVYVSVRVFDAANTWSELVQWPILESMLSLSIASWIVWRQRVTYLTITNRNEMRSLSFIFLFILSLGHISPLMAQTEEVKLEAAREKITTVSAMRVRKEARVGAEEVGRLRLGTVVNAIARSTNQDTIGGKTEYWYRVNLPNGQSGWLFGGLLLDYNAAQRQRLLRDIIEARLNAETTEFADRQEIYNLAASAMTESKNTNTRTEFELLKLIALANSAKTVSEDQINKSPYREWHKAHAAQLVRNEFAGGYNLNSEVLWNLETKYHTLPIADRIAWEASQNEQPSDCEGDEVCNFFVVSDEIKYLSLHPNGAHAAEALRDLTEALSDEVITAANGSGGDQYEVQQRTDLRKTLTTLRAAAAKTSAAEKNELLKRLQKIKP